MLDRVRIAGRSPRPLLVALCMVLVVLLGIVDVLTGTELSFILLYLIPVFLCTWYVSVWVGVVITGFSAGIWLIDAIFAEVAPAVVIWNTAMRFGFFLVVVQLIASLQRALKRERMLARTDYLTGAANSRAFEEIAERELQRAVRHGYPVTLAYIDVDDFKSVNDTFGHTVGNAVLREIAQTMLHDTRAIDTVARLGGDEFALLLPETDWNQAEQMLARLRSVLLAEMQQHAWPVTLSIGAVTFRTPPANIDTFIQVADEMMYSVKSTGKNAIAHTIWFEDNVGNAEEH